MLAPHHCENPYLAFNVGFKGFQGSDAYVVCPKGEFHLTTQLTDTTINHSHLTIVSSYGNRALISSCTVCQMLFNVL
uniref:Uncharacterized protein n=1 Tax=Leptobrachium leishanense TaxID=445787 RepID=A0A8C5MN41_9ANUR